MDCHDRSGAEAGRDYQAVSAPPIQRSSTQRMPQSTQRWSCRQQQAPTKWKKRSCMQGMPMQSASLGCLQICLRKWRQRSATFSHASFSHAPHLRMSDILLRHLRSGLFCFSRQRRTEFGDWFDTQPDSSLLVSRVRPEHCIR